MLLFLEYDRNMQKISRLQFAKGWPKRQCSHGLTLKNVNIMQQTLKKLCKLAAAGAASAGGVSSGGAGTEAVAGTRVPSRTSIPPYSIHHSNTVGGCRRVSLTHA